MKLNLPDSIASPQDLSSLISELHDYSAWASREMIKQRVSGKHAGPAPDVSKATLDLIHAWSEGKPPTQTKLDSLLKAINDYKRKATVITITLASVPSGDLRSKLVAWCRKELRPDILVTFRLNRNILGGMVVASGSHLYDWSFRRRLLERDTSYAEVLRRV